MVSYHGSKRIATVVDLQRTWQIFRRAKLCDFSLYAASLPFLLATEKTYHLLEPIQVHALTSSPSSVWIVAGGVCHREVCKPCGLHTQLIKGQRHLSNIPETHLALGNFKFEQMHEGSSRLVWDLAVFLRKIANKEFQNRVLETKQKAAQQTSIFFRFFVFSPGFSPR